MNTGGKGFENHCTLHFSQHPNFFFFLTRLTETMSCIQHSAFYDSLYVALAAWLTSLPQGFTQDLWGNCVQNNSNSTSQWSYCWWQRVTFSSKHRMCRWGNKLLGENPTHDVFREHFYNHHGLFQCSDSQSGQLNKRHKGHNRTNTGKSS